MIGWRGLPGRPSPGAEPSPDDLEDASGLTERDERALEAIRRQLDLEFGQVPGQAEPGSAAATDGRPRAPEGEAPGPPGRSPNRAWRIATVGARLLVWLIAGGLVTVLYVKNAGLPQGDQHEPPRPETVGREVAPAAPVPPSPRVSPPAGAAASRNASPAPAAPPSPAGGAATPSTARAAATSYWVQVAAFRNADSAMRLASRLRAEDLTRRSQRVLVLDAVPGVTALTRVRVGPFADRREAGSALRELRSRGYEPAITEDRR